jgi:hypothetical protein
VNARNGDPEIWTRVARDTHRNQYTAVFGLLLVLLSASTPNHFHTMVIFTCTHVCFIVTNNKMMDELATGVSTKKAGITTTELIRVL